MSARRCKENNPHACETFMNSTITDFCERMVNPKMMGYRYLSKIEPKIKCPVKAGTYNLDAMNVFLGSLLDFPVEGFRWVLTLANIGKLNGGEKKNLMTLGCIEIKARIMVSTSRKRVIKSKDVVLT